jgi:glutathione S-transferase
VIFERVFKAGFGLGAPDQTTIDRGLAGIARYTPQLNARLEANGGWLVGKDITVADYACASILMYAQAGQIPLAEYTHLTRWFEKVQATPAWKATGPPKMG